MGEGERGTWTCGFKAEGGIEEGEWGWWGCVKSVHTA